MCMNKKEIVGQVNMQRVDIVKAGEFKHLRSTFQSKGQYTRDEQEIPGRVEQVETYKMSRFSLEVVSIEGIRNEYIRGTA